MASGHMVIDAVAPADMKDRRSLPALFVGADLRSVTKRTESPPTGHSYNPTFSA